MRIILGLLASAMFMASLGTAAVAKNHPQPADNADFGQAVASDALGEDDGTDTSDGKGVDGRELKDEAKDQGNSGRTSSDQQSDEPS